MCVSVCDVKLFGGFALRDAVVESIHCHDVYESLTLE